MEFTNVQTALVLLPENGGSDDALKQSSVYQALVASSTNITEAPVNNLPTNATFEAIVTIERSFTSQQLEQLFKLLKPNFHLYIVKLNTVKNLSFLLKVNGFIVAQESDTVLIARKPDYAVGSSVKIDLNSTKKIWSIGADDLAVDDLINEDDLLEEQDKVKPSADELRVCATTKQRKACANCSCGLAEELEQEEISKVRENSQNAKSSCGNCYLGDAFRCAGCPYRGMPAFKPGEKVVLDMDDDL